MGGVTHEGGSAAVPWRWLVSIGVLAGLASLVLGLWLFPKSSPIVDERVYLQETMAVEHGHLTLPAQFHPDHDPFFTEPNGRGELMFKYPPLWPAVLAAADLATGTTRSAVPVVGAALVVGVGALGWELTKRRRVSITAAALVAACPLVLILGASRLAYAFSAALLAWSAALLVRADSTGRARSAALAGLLGGLAFVARPFDAVLVLVPIGLWVLWDSRQRGGLPQLVGWVALGAVPPAVALLWSNWRITGSPLKLPYSAVGPLDQLGFGLRTGTSSDSPLHFTLRDGLATLARGLTSSLGWMPLAVVGVMLVAVGLVRIGRREKLLLLPLIAALPLGYIVVWGAWSGYERYGLTRLVGPMYYLPSAIGVAVAAAIVLSGARRRTAVVAVVGGLAVGVAVLVPAVQRLQAARNQLASRASVLDRMARMARGPRRLFVLDVDHLLYDYPAYNDVGLQGRDVFAIDRPGRGATLLARFPSRSAVRETRRYVLHGRPAGAWSVDGLGFRRQTVVEPVRLVSGPDISARLTIRAPIGPGDVIVARTYAATMSWATSEEGTHLVRLRREDLVIDGRAGSPAPTRLPPLPRPAKGLVCLGELPSDVAHYAEICFDTAHHDGLTSVVSPGRSQALLGTVSPRMVASDVSDRLTVSVNPGGPEPTAHH